MRRALLLLHASLSALLVSCTHESPTFDTQEAYQSTGRPQPLLAVSGDQCKPPKTHPAGTIVDQVTTPSSWGIAVRDDGLTYFTEPFTSGVGITSTQTRTVDGFIPTGSVPTGIAFAPDGQHAYVANQGSNNVGVILAGSAQQIATISTEDASPFVVQVSADGTRLYIGTNIGRVYVIDTQTDAVLTTLELGNAINGFVVHPDGRFIYASSFTGGTIYEVDIVTSTVLRTFFVGGAPQDLALDRRGTTLFAANEGGYMSPVDLSTGAIGAAIPLAGGGFGVGVTPDDKEAWVSIPGLGQVQVFDLKRGTPIGVLNVGGEPRRISFSDQGKIGAVANMAGFVTLVR